MRLTDEDVKMFDALRKSELGKQLAGYVERLEAEVCDVRNWTDKDTPESARQAARTLQELRKHLGTKVWFAKADQSEFI